MKKFFAMVIIVGFLFGSFAMAEMVDLNSFSNDGLVQLYEVLKEEMYERGILRRGDLNVGAYVIGKDITEGSYEMQSANEHYCDYYVFESEESYKDYVEYSSRMPVHIDYAVVKDPVKIDLTNGQVVLVIRNIMRLSESRNGLTP